jgi:hypothetical protein
MIVQCRELGWITLSVQGPSWAPSCSRSRIAYTLPDDRVAPESTAREISKGVPSPVQSVSATPAMTK